MTRTTRNQEESRRDNRRWTADEDARLLRHIKARPQNLHYCFMMVAEEIGRTDKAVAAHWYQFLSKRPEVLCFFTASPHHISKNRKNGMGEESNSNIWRRLISIIRSIV